MQRLWIAAAAGLSLAAFSANGAESAVKSSYWTQQQQKPLGERNASRAQVCSNFFQCLFGGVRRERSSIGPSAYYGGFSDRVTRTEVSFDNAKYRPGSIIIRTPERALYYVLPGGRALRYK